MCYSTLKIFALIENHEKQVNLEKFDNIQGTNVCKSRVVSK